MILRICLSAARTAVLVFPAMLTCLSITQPPFAATNHAAEQAYTLLHVLPTTLGYVNAVACSRNGSFLAVAGDDGRVTLWNISSGRLIRVFDRQTGPVYTVAIASDDTTIATAGFDGTIHLWARDSGREIRALIGHQGWVNSVAFVANGSKLISGGRDRTVRVWDVNRGKMLQIIHYPSEVFTVAADPSGRLFASDRENSFSIREFVTGSEVAHGFPEQWGINTVVFSPSAPQLISSGYDGFLWVWNFKDAKLARRIKIDGGPIISLAVTGSGATVAALCTGNGTVALYDTTTWKEVARLKAVTYPVGSVAFSADGRILAAGGGDSPIRIWRRSDHP